MKTFNIHFLFLLVICLLLTACRANRQVVKTTDNTTTQIKESKISYKDTVFFTPKTQTSLTLPLSVLGKCPDLPINQGLNSVLNTDKPKIWTQKNGNAKATVKVLHDSIFIKAECDSLALSAKIKKVFEKDYQNQVTQRNQLVEEITKTNWWMIAGLIVIAFICGFFTNSLIKILI